MIQTSKQIVKLYFPHAYCHRKIIKNPLTDHEVEFFTVVLNNEQESKITARSAAKAWKNTLKKITSTEVTP